MRRAAARLAAIRHSRFAIRPINQAEFLGLEAVDGHPFVGGAEGEGRIGVAEGVAEAARAVAQRLPDGGVLQGDHLGAVRAAPGDALAGGLPALGPVGAVLLPVAAAGELPGGEKRGDLRILALGQPGQRGGGLLVGVEDEVEAREGSGVLEGPFRAGLGRVAELGERVGEGEARGGGVERAVGHLHEDGLGAVEVALEHRRSRRPASISRRNSHSVVVCVLLFSHRKCQVSH